MRKTKYKGCDKEILFEHIPIAKDVVSAYRTRVIRRYSARVREQMQRRHIPNYKHRSAVRNISIFFVLLNHKQKGKDFTNHLCQFLQFCMDMEKETTPHFDWFISKPRLFGFLYGMECLGRKPNTIANHAKTLEWVNLIYTRIFTIQFLKWVYSEPQIIKVDLYRNNMPAIQRELLCERQRCRKRAVPEEQELPDEEELIKIGKWLLVNNDLFRCNTIFLQIEELQKLFSFLLALMLKLISNYDIEKIAWNDKQKRISRKPISIDSFIGIEDEIIQNTCFELNLPITNTRSGNIQIIINYMQEKNVSLSELGLFLSEEEEEENNEQESNQDNSNQNQINQEESNQEEDTENEKKKDPDYLPPSENDEEEQEEDLDYETDEDNEDEELDYECFDKICYWTYETANLFQAALITLLHFSMGGQRRQVIEFMTIENLKTKKNGSTWCKTGVEKTIRPQAKDGIFVPRYVAKLINYFIKNVRPHLFPLKNVISLWISQAGTPLQADSFLRRIKMIMKSFTEEFEFDSPKEINPQDFRRLVPSIIFSQDIHPDNISMMDFIDTYSMVIGTSPRIIMIHYNRAKGNNKQINAVETIETQMLMTAEGNFNFFVFIITAVETRQQLSKLLNFEDFQSEEPQRQAVQPFKIIEDLKKQLAEKDKQIQELQHLQQHSNKDITTVPELIDDLKCKFS